MKENQYFRKPNGLKWVFLKALKEAEEQGKDITPSLLEKEHNITYRHTLRIIEDLEKMGLIEKIKERWFIETYRLTDKGKRILFQ